MSTAYTITRMTKAELALASKWAANEGWNPGLNDIDCFYITDPQGFFIGKLDGNPIAVGSAVCYDKSFAFCGFYIVAPKYRHSGYGLALTNARLAYVDKRNAGLDGVVSMLDRYERLGYKTAHFNARYQSPNRFYPAVPFYENIVPLASVPLPLLLDYDRSHFPAPRKAFLQCWIAQPNSKSLGMMHDGKLVGYGVIRPCQQGFKIAPLFANTPDIANMLFLHLANYAKGEPVYIDMPLNNPSAITLVTQYKFAKVFETARMYLKGIPDMLHAQIYGITSFELG